jgi:hypothetical protein
VCSSVAESSGSVAGDRERPADPVAEGREPSDGLVAEHEANVTIGDLGAPATHWGGGDLLLERAIGDLDTWPGLVMRQSLRKDQSASLQVSAHRPRCCQLTAGDRSHRASMALAC